MRWVVIFPCGMIYLLWGKLFLKHVILVYFSFFYRIMSSMGPQDPAWSQPSTHHLWNIAPKVPQRCPWNPPSAALWKRRCIFKATSRKRESFLRRERFGANFVGRLGTHRKKTGSAVTSLWIFWLTYGIQECTEWKEMGRLKRVIPSFKISK